MNSLFSKSALRTIAIEQKAVAALADHIGESFNHACEILLHCKARVIVLGIGKSGHVGRKIAATLASTGTPAFFVHPAEASHGDMGMLTADDVVLAISHSGNTDEILTLLPLIKRKNIPLVSLTGNSKSKLACFSDAHIDVAVEREACPMDLAPTTSTTATLVMGDAIAVALLEARDFTSEDFALSHPGGHLGKRLLLNVEDVMHGHGAVPQVSADTTISKALIEMTSKGLGITTITDHQGHLVGVFTDGDLRRAIEANIDLHGTLISQVMSASPLTISSNNLAVAALNKMETNKVTTLVVVNQENTAIGILHFLDLLRAGVM